MNIPLMKMAQGSPTDGDARRMFSSILLALATEGHDPPSNVLVSTRVRPEDRLPGSKPPVAGSGPLPRGPSVGYPLLMDVLLI